MFDEMKMEMVKEMAKMMVKENFLKGVRVGVQKKGKRPEVDTWETEFDGIEGFIYSVQPETKGIVKPGLAEILGMTRDELWERAKANTAKEANGAMMGGKGGLIMIKHDGEYGAGIVLCKDVIRTVAEDAGWKRVVMFPSSEREVMLADYDADGRNIDELGNVVKMANEFFVDKDRVLGDRAYLIEF